METLSWLPGELSPFIAILFIAFAFLTSAITAAFGLGGGVALLLIMAFFLPVTSLIPVHGAVQVGSNFGRAVVQRVHIVWPVFLAFSAGSVAGAIAGASFVIALPDHFVKAGVALFALYMVWGKVPALPVSSYKIFAVGGFFATMLTMFFGATGPFVAAILKPIGLKRHNFIGTHAATMVAQHGLKLLVFGFLGFAFGPWLALLCAMLAAGFLGTLVGSRLLDVMEEGHFKLGFNIIMTTLAVYLLIQAGREML